MLYQEAIIPITLQATIQTQAIIPPTATILLPIIQTPITPAQQPVRATMAITLICLATAPIKAAAILTMAIIQVLIIPTTQLVITPIILRLFSAGLIPAREHPEALPALA